jgi:Rrf2 family transcriptional regulator, iron-sulfur cluster assembly transcription factor
MLSRETGLCLRLLKILVERQDAWTPIPGLAEELELSRPYAAKLCHRLRNAGYLETKQGVRGGVALSGRAVGASLLDLATDLRDPFVLGRCVLLREECIPNQPCPLHDAWAQLHASTLAAFQECPITD